MGAGETSLSRAPLPSAAGASLTSRLSFIFSQMTSTRRSKTCLTLMLSLALASKNSNPVVGRETRRACTTGVCTPGFAQWGLLARLCTTEIARADLHECDTHERGLQARPVAPPTPTTGPGAELHGQQRQ